MYVVGCGECNAVYETSIWYENCAHCGEDDLDIIEVIVDEE